MSIFQPPPLIVFCMCLWEYMICMFSVYNHAVSYRHCAKIVGLQYLFLQGKLVLALPVHWGKNTHTHAITPGKVRLCFVGCNMAAVSRTGDEPARCCFGVSLILRWLGPWARSILMFITSQFYWLTHNYWNLSNWMTKSTLWGKFFKNSGYILWTQKSSNQNQLKKDKILKRTGALWSYNQLIKVEAILRQVWWAHTHSVFLPCEAVLAISRDLIKKRNCVFASCFSSFRDDFQEIGEDVFSLS